ncbi:protein crumbs homolog 3a isoform X2 [Megalops cyprinoides]|uniref:protein crumbs homolog 3a isoform X2 n=1 Tax=Megalops cyprinoides TaxID=118141 RepID=UPI001863F29C|nr:protein crumbs homolog 3a isoform X2 [Megalops cyprinoides]
MAPCSQLRVSACLPAVGLLLLVMGTTTAQGENSTLPSVRVEATSSSNSTSAPGPNIAAIVAPSVILGLLAVVSVVLVVLFCVIRKKRQTEGTYRPSSEEQTGARSVQPPDALKLPKEERLI